MEPERERIPDLIVRWEEAKARGEDPGPEEFCRECPGLLSGFRREVEKLDEVGWLDGPNEAGPPAPPARFPTFPEPRLAWTNRQRYRPQPPCRRGRLRAG